MSINIRSVTLPTVDFAKLSSGQRSYIVLRDKPGDTPIAVGEALRITEQDECGSALPRSIARIVRDWHALEDASDRVIVSLGPEIRDGQCVRPVYGRLDSSGRRSRLPASLPKGEADLAVLASEVRSAIAAIEGQIDRYRIPSPTYDGDHARWLSNARRALEWARDDLRTVEREIKTIRVVAQ